MKSKFLNRFLCAIITFVLFCTSAISVYADSSEGLAIEPDVNSVSTYLETYGHGQHYLGNFSFNSHNSSRLMTIAGNRIRVRIAFKQIDGIDDYADMRLYLKRYDDQTFLYQNLCRSQDEPDEYGYRYYVSPWANVSYGVDYYLYYIAYTCGSNVGRKVDCHVWIDVE